MLEIDINLLCNVSWDISFYNNERCKCCDWQFYRKSARFVEMQVVIAVVGVARG